MATSSSTAPSCATVTTRCGPTGRFTPRVSFSRVTRATSSCEGVRGHEGAEISRVSPWTTRVLVSQGLASTRWERPPRSGGLSVAIARRGVLFQRLRVDVVVDRDVTPRDRGGELVVHVLRHRRADDREVRAPQVRDPRDVLGHEVLVELDPAVGPVIARERIALRDVRIRVRNLVLDLVEGRQDVVAALLRLVGGHAELGVVDLTLTADAARVEQDRERRRVRVVLAPARAGRDRDEVLHRLDGRVAGARVQLANLQLDADGRE